jgi:hypothetical protein
MIYTLYISDGGPVPVSTSPDGQWLAFFACNRDDDDLRCKQTYVYGYDVANSKLISSGFFEGRETIFEFDRWVGTQVIISTSEMGEYHLRKYFIADASRSDSVEPAFSRFRLNGDYFGNPPRYEFVTGWESEGFAGCTWVRYEITTRILTEHDMKSLCRADRGLPVAGNSYYRQVNNPRDSTLDHSTAGLIRFNPVTGEYVEIYRDEIEEVVWVSPDEQYALLVLDSNGEIDTFPFLISFNTWRAMPQARLVLLNLTNGREIYQTSLGSDPGYGAFDGYSSTSQVTHADLIPINDHEWLIFHIADYPDGDPWQAPTIVDAIDADGKPLSPEFPYNHPAYVLPDRRGFVYWIGDRSESLSAGYYDVLSGKTFQIVKDLDAKTYRLSFQVNEANDLEAHISRVDAEPYSEIQNYVIHIKGTSESGIAAPTTACQLTMLSDTNFRARPAVDAEKIGSALVNTTLYADAQILGADGFTWWRLTAAQGWVRQDLVAESEGCTALPVVTP